MDSRKKDYDYKSVVTAGEMFAVKMKNAIFPDRPWTPLIALSVGYTMSAFKKVAKKFYPELNEVQLLHKLGGYSEIDIVDGFKDPEFSMEGKCEPNQPSHIGRLIEGCTATIS